MAILVTGGAGFIGSNFVLEWIRTEGAAVVNLDKLTYAGDLRNLASLEGDDRHTFVRGDIRNRDLLVRLFEIHRPDAVVHFAAETHVDRSIASPDRFVETNVVGTSRLLEASLAYWRASPAERRKRFRFVQVSTDEVFGSLGPDDRYAASKAAADHLARACFRTHGLPIVTTHGSNNHGPHQFPEKWIPLAIARALRGEPIPIYGDGRQIRDWLHVTDHCAAIRAVLGGGRPGDTYLVGSGEGRTNREVVEAVCRHLDVALPDSPHRPHARLIRSVEDRPGHDRRYAIDPRKIETELGWRPAETFESGLEKTVAWMLANRERSSSAAAARDERS